MGISANRNTFMTVLKASDDSCRLPKAEVNWMLERAVILGGRPSDNLMTTIVEQCKDHRQACFYLVMSLRHRLINPSKILRLAEKLQRRAEFEDFPTKSGKLEALSYIKVLLSEARSAMVGYMSAIRKRAKPRDVP